jgi:hypothetical protein
MRKRQTNMQEKKKIFFPSSYMDFSILDFSLVLFALWTICPVAPHPSSLFSPPGLGLGLRRGGRKKEEGEKKGGGGGRRKEEEKEEEDNLSACKSLRPKRCICNFKGTQND